jgi:hypothetical protein
MWITFSLFISLNNEIISQKKDIKSTVRKT